MLYVFLFCLIGTTLCQVQQVIETEDNWQPESRAAQFLGLPSGASQVVPNIRTTFSCIGRGYGYFADVDNNCQIFHICHPSVRANGAPVIYHYSKFCPAQTRFDQTQMTCVQETNPRILPCIESLRYYPHVESRFANVPVIQRGVQIEQIHEPVEQRLEQIPIEQIRQEVYPTKNIIRSQVVDNVALPTKNLIRSEVELSQPIVQKPLPVVVAQRPLIQQRLVAKQPIQYSVPIAPQYVPQYVPQSNIPFQTYSVPIQTSVLRQTLPTPVQSIPVRHSVQQPVVQHIIHQTPVQNIPQPLIQTVPQTVPQSVHQPIPQTVPQPQTFSVQQDIDQGFDEVVPQAVQPQIQSVQQTVPVQQPAPVQQSVPVQQPTAVREASIQNREEGLVERPAQTLPQNMPQN